MPLDNDFFLFYIAGALTGIAVVAMTYGVYCSVLVIQYRRGMKRAARYRDR